MLAAWLRWALFGYGALVAAATIYVRLRGYRRWPHGADIVGVGVGVAAICLAVGALYRHPIGWIAGLVLALFTLLEPVLPLPDRPAGWTVDWSRAANVVSVSLHVALLVLLVSSLGRHIFRLGLR